MRRLSAVAGASLLLAVAGCDGVREVRDAGAGLDERARSMRDLAATFEGVAKLTYTATYEWRRSDGVNVHPVLAQRPPRSSFRQGDQLLVDDGQRLVHCAGQRGQERCREVGPHTGAGVYAAASEIPGSSLAVLHPTPFLGYYSAPSLIQGASTSRTRRIIAGESSECVTVEHTQGDAKGKRFGGCTTNDGIVSRYDDGEGNVVTLTRLERSVDDALLAWPAAALGQQGGATSTTTP